MSATCQTQSSHFWNGGIAVKNQKIGFNHGAELPFGRLIEKQSEERPISPDGVSSDAGFKRSAEEDRAQGDKISDGEYPEGRGW
jgi:hypothetical protein